MHQKEKDSVSIQSIASVIINFVAIDGESQYEKKTLTRHDHGIHRRHRVVVRHTWVADHIHRHKHHVLQILHGKRRDHGRDRERPFQERSYAWV
jgi:hypothetical protein